MFDIVGGAKARLAALHVDDGAERALIRTAAPGVETGAQAERALDVVLGQKRHRCAVHGGQVFHEIVQRGEPIGGGVAQHVVEPVLGFAGEHGDTHISAGVEFNRTAIQHRQASRDVKAAHRHGNTSRAKRPRNIERARILVGLHADQTDETEIAMRLEAREQRRHIDARIGLVDHLDVDSGVRAEHLPFGAIHCDAVDGGKRIRGDQRPPPADDIAVIVIVRWLDQNELKAPLGFHRAH
jgi:hypothetical protein